MERSSRQGSTPSIRQRYKRVSGNAVGRNSKRILGCENCNFMQLHSTPPKATNSVSHEVAATGMKTVTVKGVSKQVSYTTGDVCPRCALPCLRVYDSQAEFGRAQELKILRDRGDIFDLEFQRPFVLYAQPLNDPKARPVALYKYVSDFCYRINRVTQGNPTPVAEFIVEDVKPKGGIVTDVFMMKKKHFEAEYGIDITIVER